eukprot:355827-Chlamydomonas_euryale.AAC.2
MSAAARARHGQHREAAAHAEGARAGVMHQLTHALDSACGRGQPCRRVDASIDCLWRRLHRAGPAMASCTAGRAHTRARHTQPRRVGGELAAKRVRDRLEHVPLPGRLLPVVVLTWQAGGAHLPAGHASPPAHQVAHAAARPAACQRRVALPR